MKKIRIWLLGFVCIFAITGCNDIEDSINDLRAELNRDIEIAQNDTPNQNEEISIEETYETVPTKAEPAVPKIEVALYFADSAGTKLIKTTREIPKEEGVARATINALLAGPTENGQISPIPSGTTLLDIHIKDGLCIIDLSQEFLDAGKGIADENLAIQAIVQTLCQFDTVNKVEFRVNGESLESLNNTQITKEVFADHSIL